jgi:hypothetical protein
MTGGTPDLEENVLIRHAIASGLLLVGLGLFLPGRSLAGPWLDPGDSALRHDIQILADEGAIPGPVLTWPLSVADLSAALERAPSGLSDAGLAALARVSGRLGFERSIGKVRTTAHASAAQNPRQIRAFEDGPRENAEVGLGVEWTGERFGMRLEGQWVDDPEDGKDLRADGSWIGVALGNWKLAGSIADRYWGPGWQSSMIMSNNARPLPSIQLDRNLTTAPESKWLSWIGPWDLSILYSFLDDDRVLEDTQQFSVRFDFRPAPRWEIGISVMGQFCGEGEGCGVDELFDMLTGQGDTLEYDRLASWDIRWTTQGFGQPLALYTHWVGEDFGDGPLRLVLPTKLFAQFGIETWGYLNSWGSYRLFAEWADTECDFNLYRKLTFDGGGGKTGCAYWNRVYRTGERYRGRVYGHSFDQDSSVATLGGMLVTERDQTWLATLAYGTLNRRGQTRSVAATNQTRYGEVEVTHIRPMWIGRLSLGLGYEYRDDEVLDDTNHDVRAFMKWEVASF